MKKLLVAALFFASPLSYAKLSDSQAMKCIDGDKLTKSAFQDLQAAYEMRMVTAKDFFKVLEKPTSCPQLRKDLKKLQATAVAQFPQSKTAKSHSSAGIGGGSDFYSPAPTPGGGFSNHSNLGKFNDDEDMGFPPPPPLPESDFEEDFDDFR